MDPLIEFLAPQDCWKDFPAPFPARREIPDWLKNMPTETGTQYSTVKHCMPFLDAMTTGYLIPVPCEIHWEISPQGDIRARSPLHMIMDHDKVQFPGAPFENQKVIKFRSPWVVKTPPGYSCLFVAPLNRFECPFRVLPGVVDTDTYYAEIFFPALTLLKPGQKFIMPKGMPIVQVIPFKREDWKSVVAPQDPAERERVRKEFNENIHAYRQNYRAVRTFE